MKKVAINFIAVSFTVACIFTQFALPLLPPVTITSKALLDQIVAVVNNEIITQSELSYAISIAKQQIIQQHIPLPEEKILKQQLLNQLIYQKLQLQLAKQNDLKVTDKEVNTAITHINTRNHFSKAALKQELAQEGITYTQFYNQLQKQLIISKLQHQAVGNYITISQSDIAAFKKQHQNQLALTRYHAETILIPMPDFATQAQINRTREKAILVLKQIRSGSSFFKTAMKMHSGSVDLGWRTANDLPQIFARTIIKMKLNEIAGPIQAPNGFHIIKLIDKEVKSRFNDRQVQQIIYQKKFEQALQKWLLQLRHSAYVRIYQY